MTDDTILKLAAMVIVGLTGITGLIIIYLTSRD